jgi:hypothetical protein
MLVNIFLGLFTTSYFFFDDLARYDPNLIAKKKKNDQTLNKVNLRILNNTKRCSGYLQ